VNRRFPYNKKAPSVLAVNYRAERTPKIRRHRRRPTVTSSGTDESKESDPKMDAVLDQLRLIVLPLTQQITNLTEMVSDLQRQVTDLQRKQSDHSDHEQSDRDRDENEQRGQSPRSQHTRKTTNESASRSKRSKHGLLIDCYLDRRGCPKEPEESEHCQVLEHGMGTESELSDTERRMSPDPIFEICWWPAATPPASAVQEAQAAQLAAATAPNPIVEEQSLDLGRYTFNHYGGDYSGPLEDENSRLMGDYKWGGPPMIYSPSPGVSPGFPRSYESQSAIAHHTAQSHSAAFAGVSVLFENSALEVPMMNVTRSLNVVSNDNDF